MDDWSLTCQACCPSPLTWADLVDRFYSYQCPEIQGRPNTL